MKDKTELFETDSQAAEPKKIAPKKKAGAKTIVPEKPKVVKPKLTRAGAKREPESEVSALIRFAIKEDAGLDKLERLITLKNQEEDRAAKKEFDFHFAEMQRELIPVRKTKDGSKTNTGKVIFKYAPLEEIKKLNDPVITKHGFSCRWREEKIGDDGEKRVRLIINGWGWTDEATYFDIPKIATNNITTEVQTRAAQSTYGRRNTYVSGIGITIEGEDDESLLSFEDGVDYAPYIARIKASPDMKILMTNYQKVTQELGSDYHGKEIIAMVKDDMKKELSNGA